MSTDFFRACRTQGIKVKDGLGRTGVREPGVRLYKDAPSHWVMQVRTPVQLANGEDGRDFIVASASLTFEDLKSICDAARARLVEELQRPLP